MTTSRSSSRRARVSARSAYCEAAGGSGHEDGKSEYLRYETDSVELCGAKVQVCLLYTSDAADEVRRV